MRRSALSPRGAPAGVADLASRGRLIRGQRVDRHRARRRAARRVRWLAGRVVLVAAVALAAGAFGAGAKWLLSSPRFAVASVEISGNSRVTREEIEAAAGIAPGTNIFALDPSEIAARLESLPLVRRAEVVRTLPDRVAITVEERRPFTLVHTGRLHWIDEHGVNLGPEARPVALGTPVISGVSADELDGPKPDGRAAVGLALVRLLLRSNSGLLQAISEIDVSRPDGPVLYTLDGLEVRLGRDDWEARLGRLLGVLAQIRASGEAVKAIDLRFRDQVVLLTSTK